MYFPPGFIWGSATSSYQIEGETPEEGRGDCIWTTFSRTEGKVVNGETGLIACDHVHRYREDVQLLKNLGVSAYRFSLAWPRVLPKGTGSVNEIGIEFYSKLTDALLEVGITPYVTLYHWDLPQALQDRGGWENPDSVGWFADYTDLVTRALGDRVNHWITHNEPWCTSMLGNWFGVHAPGKQDMKTAYKVAHHVLLSHGASMNVIRQNVKDSQAGITLNLGPAYPATDDPKDTLAASYEDGFFNRWFLDPVMKGEYPADMVELLGPALDGLDLAAIKDACVPQDFLGVNYYSRSVKRWSDEPPFYNASVMQPDSPHTEMGWEVYPQALTDLLLRLTRDYNPPAILITENGASYIDPLPVDGVVEDPKRVNYYRIHLEALSKAIEQGAPVKGYFAWSLMDNFEWAEGYAKRFGLYYVDFVTQKRTPKRSALFIRGMATGNPVADLS